MEIEKILATELGIEEWRVVATLKLIKEGNTIPFIARYRKEMTGSLDDTVLRNLSERLAYLENLEERRKAIISSIQEQGKLTEEIKRSLEEAIKLSDLENIYRPYKKKRKTRGSMAKEAGLAPLASIILEQWIDDRTLETKAQSFLCEEKGYGDVASAIQGCEDIIAEEMGDVSSFYDDAKAYIERTGRLESKQSKEDINNKYLTYASFSSPVRFVKNYQILALNRGEKEKCLSVSFNYDKQTLINAISRKYLIRGSSQEARIRKVAEDAFKRLIAPTVENSIRGELFLKAEDSSLIVFKDNLKQLLMVKPLKGQRVLGFDPAFINGCKLASVDEFGNLLHVDVIYPTMGKGRIEESKKILLHYLNEDKIDYIALGNGTASRESEAFLRDALREANKETKIVIVNEAGASVYSASSLASDEYPNLTVEKRSAISLARRLQDPLPELVKIDPMSLGVGQYQHDMNEKKLSFALNGVVENAVNEVGVNLNNASISLLKFVSGIGPTLAANIVEYRETHGPFHTREELKNVPKLGPKAFTQAAGFLRIPGGNPLDNTGVHPESYGVVSALLKRLGLSLLDLGSNKAFVALSSIKDNKNYSQDIGCGEDTFKDILQELMKPGRDPRDEASSAELDTSVTDMKDLKPGMILNGTIRNIVDFGVFVDLGVHQDGLVHISELSNSSFSTPLEVVHLNDIVKVKVLSVDIPRKRIALSIKQVKE